MQQELVDALRVALCHFPLRKALVHHACGSRRGLRVFRNTFDGFLRATQIGLVFPILSPPHDSGWPAPHPPVGGMVGSRVADQDALSALFTLLLSIPAVSSQQDSLIRTCLTHLVDVTYDDDAFHGAMHPEDAYSVLRELNLPDRILQARLECLFYAAFRDCDLSSRLQPRNPISYCASPSVIRA